jgi:hypothetical protein
LDDGVVLVRETRGLLVAAARSVVERRAHHPPGQPPGPVRAYLDRVRLGQTEQGSYVVTLLSPIGTDAAEAERAGRLPLEDPFPRTAVAMLARALETARDTAERVAAGVGRLETFHETVEAGVSANLCDSLAKIGGRSHRGFSVSLDGRQPPGPRTCRRPSSSPARPIGSSAAPRRCYAGSTRGGAACCGDG